MEPTKHRLRPERWWWRRPVEPTARGRAARRELVEAASGRTGRDYGLGQCFRDHTLAKPSGGLCCLGAARADRRVPWVGYRSDQPWLSRPLGSCRTDWTQSTLRLGRSPDNPRGDGRDRLFSVLSSNIPAALALPLLLALSRIRSTEIHFGRACGQPDHHTPTPPRRTMRLMLWKNYGLLIFAGCLFLFQFVNTSMLPLAGEELVNRNGMTASLAVSTLIIVPQIVVALTAPWAGREAQSWGRRPLLLLGFSALAVRALLFAVATNPLLLICIQLLDGISGSMLGVLTALIVADLTKGSGRFNLAQGFVGTLAGIGASLSTTFFSLVVEYFGGAIGFISIACVALSLVLIVWFWMPETRPSNNKQHARL